MSTEFSLTNHFLIAMPSMADPHFVRSVTYVAEHTENGALGIIVNRPTDVMLSEVLSQMNIKSRKKVNQTPVFYGGPVHQERGFVIHSPKEGYKSSFAPANNISITTSRDILEDIATEKGPDNAIVTLGYAGWDAGQLENEMVNNTWISCQADSEIIFNTALENRWQKALELAGIKDIASLSQDVGHG